MDFGVGVSGMVNTVYGTETATTGVLSGVSSYYFVVFRHCIAGV